VITTTFMMIGDNFTDVVGQGDDDDDSDDAPF
jgi:hypothetical protein